LLLPFCWASAQADNYFYLMGGGDTADTRDTIFDDDVTELGPFFSTSNWHTTISYDGGHSATKMMISRSFPKAQKLGDFTNTGFDKMISSMKDKLESGAIKSGDQLLIDFETHGSKKDNDAKEVTHSIGTLDGTVSLDALREVIALATQKGVKLAIMDMSCYSGQTLNIANDKICMITGTGPDQFSITDSIDDSMYRAFRKGANLEDLYSHAREVGKKNDFPMINTPAGIKVQNELYGLVNSYLNFDDDGDGASNASHEFSDEYSITEDPDKLPAGVTDGEASALHRFESERCTAEANFSELMTFLGQSENTIGGIIGRDPTADLKVALQHYRDYQIKYENIANAAITAGKEVKDLIARLYPDQRDQFKEEDGLAVLGADYDGSLKTLTDLLNSSVPGRDPDFDWDKKYYTKQIEIVQKKKEIAEDVKRHLSQDSQSAIARYKNAYRETERVTEPLATAVSIALKKVYPLLYKAASSSEPNACSSFVL
jgi:hypothetical protein